MANHYVDLGTIAAWDTRDGATSGACWYGLTGLQNAFDHCTAGDVCYIKGTYTMASSGDVGKFYSVAFDAETAPHLTNGEECTWGVDATNGHGIVHWVGADMLTPLEIEILSGAAPANDVEITGATSGGKIMPTATIALKGIDADTNAGTNAAGYIRFIGVNASWAVDGTRAIIDVNSVAVHGITITAAAGVVILENLEVDAAGTAKHGFNITAEPIGLICINCCAHNCASNGFSVAGRVLFLMCVAYSNSATGFTGGTGGARFVFCCSRDNTSNGFTARYEDFIGCIAHNTGTGFAPDLIGNCFALNCVFDSNTAGVSVGAKSAESYKDNATFLGCRLTNNTTGIDHNTCHTLMGWNFFDTNTADQADSTLAQVVNSIADTNLYAQDDTNQGYADAVANHNFATGYVDGTDPLLRRTAITIPWS